MARDLSSLTSDIFFYLQNHTLMVILVSSYSTMAYIFRRSRTKTPLVPVWPLVRRSLLSLVICTILQIVFSFLPSPFLAGAPAFLVIVYPATVVFILFKLDMLGALWLIVKGMPMDAFTVDVLTSVSKVFSDLPCQWYRWIHGWPLGVLPWHDDLACFSRSIVFPLLIALPYALRLVQCIREWNWRSSVNAVKFATILLFLVFQALRSVDDARWQAAYLSTGIVSSLLSIGWNIYFDLEVTARWNDVVTLFFDLPMELLRWCFCVWFMLIDSVIRFNWCWKMLSPKRTWVAFLFSLLELFRRFHWIYFRLDREVQAAGPGLPQTAKASNIQLCARDEPARCALDGPLALTRSSSCPLPRASRFSEQWG